MKEEKDEKSDVNRSRLFGVMLSSMPSLLFKFGGLYLRFKSEAKKGGRVFQKELIKQGIDRETAEELTRVYLKGSDLLKFMHLFR